MWERRPRAALKMGEVGNPAQTGPAAPCRGVMDAPVGHLALRKPPSHAGVNKGLDSQVTLSWPVLWGWEQGGRLWSGATTVWGRKEGQELPVEHSPGGCSLLCTHPAMSSPFLAMLCSCKVTKAWSLPVLLPGSMSTPGSVRLGQDLGSLPAASGALRCAPH